MTDAPKKAVEIKPAYNAGDEEHVADRKRESKEREDMRREGLRFVMSAPRGRAWMRHLLVEKLFNSVGKTLPPDSFTGNSTTFYNAGSKRVGELLTAELKTYCRDEYRKMEDEGDNINAA